MMIFKIRQSLVKGRADAISESAQAPDPNPLPRRFRRCDQIIVDRPGAQIGRT